MRTEVGRRGIQARRPRVSASEAPAWVRFSLNSPRLGERTLEIPTENELDVPAGIVPPYQAFGQIVDFLRIVDAIKVESPCRTNPSVPSVQIDIAPYAGMLNPDRFGQMVNVIQYMLDGDSWRGPDHIDHLTKLVGVE